MQNDLLKEKFGICQETLNQVCARTGLDAEDIEELQEELATTLAENLDQAIKEHNEGDTAALKRCAHSIKGGAAQVGMMPVSEIGLKMEQAAHNGALDEWHSGADQLRELSSLWNQLKS